jgi:hypothetical protein
LSRYLGHPGNTLKSHLFNKSVPFGSPLPPNTPAPPLSQSYLSCISLFRFIHSTARFLPSYRLIRRLRRSSDDPGILIEVHVSGERGRWGVGLGEPFGGRDGSEFATRAETGSG